LGAVKDNQPWTVNFNPGGTIGYEVRNSAGKAMKTVDFRNKYSNTFANYEKLKAGCAA
jgi:hypothetical protein